MQDEIALTPDEGAESSRANRRINYGLLSQDIYSVQDLATVIGVHTTTILAQIKAGKIKALYLGGPAGYRIHREDVLNWVRNI